MADTGATPAVGKSTLTEALGPGESLPADHRARFEKSLGRDLSQVRVHTDDHASRLADIFGSRAFASGGNIAFAKGEYDPKSRDGAHLLAHEVAHVAQQAGAAPSAAPATTQPGDAVEANADTAAGAMIAGQPAQVAAAPIAIARRTVAEPRAPRTATDDASKPGEPSNDQPGDKPGDKPDDEIGELTAARIGQEVDEGTAPPVPVRDSEGARRELADAGRLLPQDGIAEGAAPDIGGGGAASTRAEATGAGASPEAGAEAGPDGSGEAGAAAAAQVHQAQQEAREAGAAAEAESAAYKAQLAERRERFDAEQHDMALAQLKTMSPADKRSTLVELGYDPKKIGQLKDAELDSLISGKLEAEQQKTKILGMTPEELAALSPAQKVKFLTDLGIDRADLDKAGPAKTDKLFDDVTRQAHIPGSHKVKIQIKGGPFGKSWVVTVQCDTDGGVDVQAKKEGGIFSKLVGWIKSALPLVLTVLAPITGGASLIALSVYQTVSAIKSGNWLGAVIGAAGALVGVGALKAVAQGTGGLAQALGKVATVAGKVKKVAEAAQAAMVAAKAKNAGSLLAALSSGAAAFAGFAGNAAGKFAETMKQWSARLQKWSQIAAGGQQVVKSIKAGDPIAAVGAAFATAAKVAGTGRTGKDLERAGNITNLINAGRKALDSKPPNYGAVADAAFGIAEQLTHDRRVEDAQRIVQAAGRLRAAWNARGSNPAGLADAALHLAEAIQLGKYDLDHKQTTGADGKPVPDAARDHIVARYQRATRTVQHAGAVIKAATARPHPDCTAALDAATQLVAELTDDKRIDAAAVVTSKTDAFRRAVASGNLQKILEAGYALAQAVDGLRTTIEDARTQARQDAQAQLPAGEHLADDGGALPSLPSPPPPAGPGRDAQPGETSPGVHGPQLDPDAEATGPGPAPQPTPPSPPAAPASPQPPKQPSISGVVVAGGPLRDDDVDAINKEAQFAKTKRYIAYADIIKIGGAISWRANNPGNLRDFVTKIGTAPADVGIVAVFASPEAGRDAQRRWYLHRYGTLTVRAAISALTPPNENDTAAYLRFLASTGVDLDNTVAAQIDLLMASVKRAEGKDIGIELMRSPQR